MEYYVAKHEGNVSKLRNQKKYNRFMKSNVLHDQMQRKHKVTNAIVELVDIFPTIADLASVPIPICQVLDRDHKTRLSNLTYKKEPNLCSEGITLLPLIKSILKCQVRRMPDLISHTTKILYKIKDILSLSLFSSLIYICKNLERILEKGSI